MVDEAASSIVVDEATAINTNAVQQLTVSDHPRVRRNSTGDSDGIHYYENHESLLMEPRFVTYRNVTMDLGHKVHDFVDRSYKLSISLIDTLVHPKYRPNTPSVDLISEMICNYL